MELIQDRLMEIYEAVGCMCELAEKITEEEAKDIYNENEDRTLQHTLFCLTMQTQENLSTVAMMIKGREIKLEEERETDKEAIDDLDGLFM